MARKIRHLVAIGIGMNKMAEGDKYLDYLDKTLEQAVKPLSTSLGRVTNFLREYSILHVSPLATEINFMLHNACQ